MLLDVLKHSYCAYRLEKGGLGCGVVKDCKQGGGIAVSMAHSGAGRVYYATQQPHWILVSYLGNNQGWSIIFPRFLPISNLFYANDSIYLKSCVSIN